jgi:hypothetical protein
MRSRGLLVTFDAWKTLFTPREAVATQYVRLAREHGVDVQESAIDPGFKRGNFLLECAPKWSGEGSMRVGGGRDAYYPITAQCRDD